MYWIITFTVAVALTLLDLDRTFYVPRTTGSRWKLRAWWFGFILVNGVLALVIYFALRDVEPFKEMNPWVYGLTVGLGYLAAVRIKFSTFQFQGKEVPFGFEAFYDASRAYAYSKINSIARAARIREAEELIASSSLQDLGRRARLNVQHDRLLTVEEKNEALKWIVAILKDTAVDDLEKKEYLANFVLSGDRAF